MSARPRRVTITRPRLATGVDLSPNERPIIPAGHCHRTPAQCQGAADRRSSGYPSRVAVIRTVSKFMTNEPP